MTPSDDPIAAFIELHKSAKAAESFDADRAVLATSAGGRPNARFVLVREAGDDGFVFYTDYRSAKARDLALNPRAALAWHWASTGVQVRVEGHTSRVSAARSDAYFAARPRGSQIGAWASEQSAVIESRAALEARVVEVSARFEGGDVPRPKHWGGFVLAPARIELWFNQDDRLHDRHLYTRVGASWTRSRLCP